MDQLYIDIEKDHGKFTKGMLISVATIVFFVGIAIGYFWAYQAYVGG